MHYFKLSGFIPENKQKEFEQTYRLVSSQMPSSCKQHSVSRDLLHKNVFHFVSYWDSLTSMEIFSGSSECTIMIGAFKTLGELYDDVRGEMQQVKN